MKEEIILSECVGFDWNKGNQTNKTVSLRLPEDLLNEIKIMANKEDIPYQSLMKMLLARGIHFLRK